MPTNEKKNHEFQRYYCSWYVSAQEYFVIVTDYDDLTVHKNAQNVLNFNFRLVLRFFAQTFPKYEISQKQTYYSVHRLYKWQFPLNSFGVCAVHLEKQSFI